MKKNEPLFKVDLEEIEPLKLHYRDELLLNPAFSLDPDPTGELKMTENEKLFTRLLIRYGFTNFDSLKETIEMISKDMGLTYDETANFWYNLNVKNEYDRISLAIRHRQYNQKQFSLTEIKSLLTSMVIGNYSSYSKSLTEKDKLDALKLLTNIIQEEQRIITNTSRLNAINVNVEEVKDLSITEIKALVAGIDENKAEDIKKQKQVIINQMQILNPSLHPNQIDFLYNLPIDELKNKLDYLKNVNEEHKKNLPVVEEAPREIKEGSVEWKLKKMAEEKRKEKETNNEEEIIIETESEDVM